MSQERVGFCGLGTMGAAMAANLVRAGFAVTVSNRTAGRAGQLVDMGAREAGTAREVGLECEIVVICVSDTPDVEAVIFGPDGLAQGIAERDRPGSLIIDCSTISPAATRGFATRLADLDAAMVDAPVSGGSEGAVNASLTIMVGGEPAQVERAMPILRAMGRSITHMGPLGAGQVTKAVNQVILAGAYLGVAEGLVLAMRAGLDAQQVVEALSAGAARSWVLENRSGRMIEDDYPLGFKVVLHRKDLAIALELARQLGVALPVSALAEQMENGLVSRGHGDEDVSALARTIRAWSGM